MRHSFVRSPRSSVNNKKQPDGDSSSSSFILQERFIIIIIIIIYIKRLQHQQQQPQQQQLAWITHSGGGQVKERGHAHTECVRRDNGFADGIGQLEGIERYRREFARKILSQPSTFWDTHVRHRDGTELSPPPWCAVCRRK